MKFRVQIERREKFAGNPFIASLIHRKVETVIRTWEIEANSKEEIEQYFKEAVEQGIQNVCGFELRSIEEIPDV